MILPVKMNDFNYDVVIEKGCINHVNEYLDLNRKVLILTDSLVPINYSNIVKEKSKEGYIYTIASGEASKSFENYGKILDYLVEHQFSRTDCIVAVGGGVVGDLAGFVASTYMRGITFYNIPTTLLSQVDSSIGGKTAIDKCGIKNIVGAFYPPHKVLIDTDLLKTLDNRQLHSGLVEAIKMGLTNDQELFDLIKNSNNLFDDIETIVTKALMVKKMIVEADPKEKGLRRVLNYGHTIGHAIESSTKYLHGECVGLGMLCFASFDVRKEIKEVLEKYKLPISHNVDNKILYDYICLDKKRSGNKITIVYVEEKGNFKFLNIELEAIKDYLK